MKILAFLVALLISTGAFAQVKQSGTVTSTHPACWSTNGVIQDCGNSPTKSPYASGYGITSPNQSSFIINSGAITAAYEQLSLGSTATAGWLIYKPVGGAGNQPLNIVAPSLNFVINGTTYPCCDGGGGGGVLSVALALPSIFNVTGSPVTSTGTLTGAFANQAPNQVFASPVSSTNVPTFRGLVSADLPVGSSTQKGAVQCDNVTITCAGGTLVSVGGGGGAAWNLLSNLSPTIDNITNLTLNNFVLTGVGSTAQAYPGQPNYNKTASYTLNASENDIGAQVNFNGSGLTVTFPSAVFAANLSVVIVNTSSTFALTVANAGSYALNGLATLSIPPNAGVGCTSDGTNFNCVTFGYPAVNPYLATPETWTGQQNFNAVNGASNTSLTGATYTLAASDCGKTLLGSYASGTATWTIPAAIVPAAGKTCIINIITTTANKIAVNGSAVSAATLINPNLFTGTTNVAGSEITLTLATVSSVTTAYLAGNGS